MERLGDNLSRKFCIRGTAAYRGHRLSGFSVFFIAVAAAGLVGACQTQTPLTGGDIASTPIDVIGDSGTGSADPAAVAGPDASTSVAGADNTNTAANSSSPGDPAEEDKFKAPTVPAQADVATTNVLRSLTLRGSDTLNRDLTFAIMTSPAHGALGALDNSGNNFATVAYAPASGFQGTDSFTFRATNGLRWSATATFTITVSRPTAISQSVSTAQNSPLVIRLQGQEPTGGDLTFHVSGALHGTLSGLDNSPLSSAVVTYTPQTGYTGTDLFTFTADVPGSGSPEATVNVLITVPDGGTPPAISPSGPVALSVLQNSVAGNPGNRLTFVANDSDTAVGLVWSISGAAVHGTARIESGSPSASGANVVVSYAPTTGYLGSDQFRTMVSDGRNTAEVIVNVTINAVSSNNPPVPNPSGPIAQCVLQNSLNTDALNRLTLSATDPDPSPTLTWTVSTAPAHGVVTISGSPTGSGGQVTVAFQPTTGYAGPDLYEIQVSDGQGGAAKVRVNATVDRQPTFTASSYAMCVMRNTGQPMAACNQLAVTANDLDAGTTLSWRIVPPGSTHAAFLSFSPSAPATTQTTSAPGVPVTITYNPVTGYTGTDSYDLIVSDGCVSVTRTVSITVSASAVSPSGGVTLNVLQNSLSTDAANRFTRSAALAPSMPTACGAAQHVWTICTAPSRGIAAIVSGSPSADNGSVVVAYQPTNGYTGSDSFSVCVSSTTACGGAAAASIPVTVNVTPPTPAGTYYVDTNNPSASDSNPGTQASPFKTIQRAANLVNPGDIVIVKAGTYNEYVRMTRSGSSSRPITFQANPGSMPIVDGQNVRAYGIHMDNAAYVIVDGFEVRNCTSHGVFIEDLSNGCTARNNVIHHCGWFGVYVRGPDDCRVEWNECYACQVGVQINGRDTTLNAVYRVVVSHNLCHDNTNLPEENDGIDGVACHDSIFEYNLVWGCYDDGIDISAPSGTPQGSVWGPTNCEIKYNAVWNSGGGVDGDGNGIKTSTNAGGSHWIHHNIVFNNRASGFDNDQENNWGPNRWYNNTSYGNGTWGIGLDMAGVTSISSAAIVMNNIFAASNRLNQGVHDYGASGQFNIGTSDYNFIADGQFATLEGSHSLPGRNLSGNPMLVNPTGTINTTYTGTGGIHGKWQFIWDQVQANFALSPSSTCVDRGLTLPGYTDGFTGSAPDIGAVER